MKVLVINTVRFKLNGISAVIKNYYQAIDKKNLQMDFVAIDESNIAYYQVAATVRDEMTLKRELASLQRISDQYPKYILTLDDDPSADYDGIKRINALKWLMGEFD